MVQTNNPTLLEVMKDCGFELAIDQMSAISAICVIGEEVRLEGNEGNPGKVISIDRTIKVIGKDGNELSCSHVLEVASMDPSRPFGQDGTWGQKTGDWGKKLLADNGKRTLVAGIVYGTLNGSTFVAQL